MQIPYLRVIVATGAVHGGLVVPHDEVKRLPGVRVHALALRSGICSRTDHKFPGYPRVDSLVTEIITG